MRGNYQVVSGVVCFCLGVDVLSDAAHWTEPYETQLQWLADERPGIQSYTEYLRGTGWL